MWKRLFKYTSITLIITVILLLFIHFSKTKIIQLPASEQNKNVKIKGSIDLPTELKMKFNQSNGVLLAVKITPLGSMEKILDLTTKLPYHFEIEHNQQSLIRFTYAEYLKKNTLNTQNPKLGLIAIRDIYPKFIKQHTDDRTFHFLKARIENRNEPCIFSKTSMTGTIRLSKTINAKTVDQIIKKNLSLVAMSISDNLVKTSIGVTDLKFESTNDVINFKLAIKPNTRLPIYLRIIPKCNNHINFETCLNGSLGVTSLLRLTPARFQILGCGGIEDSGPMNYIAYFQNDIDSSLKLESTLLDEINQI